MSIPVFLGAVGRVVSFVFPDDEISAQAFEYFSAQSDPGIPTMPRPFRDPQHAPEIGELMLILLGTIILTGVVMMIIGIIMVLSTDYTDEDRVDRGDDRMMSISFVVAAAIVALHFFVFGTSIVLGMWQLLFGFIGAIIELIIGTITELVGV